MMGVYQQGQKWMCDFTPVGRKRIRIGFASEQRAREEYVRLNSKFDTSMPSSYHFVEYAQRIINSEESVIPKNTVASHKNSLMRLGQTIPEDYRLTDIDAEVVGNHVVKRKDDSVSNATINRELAFLSKICNLAIEADELIKNPVTSWRNQHKRVSNRKPLPESRGRDRFLTIGEIRLMLDVANVDPIKGILETAVFSGMRQEEVFGLKWKDINQQAQTVSIKRKWKDEPQSVPVCDLVINAIMRQKRDSLFVFPAKDGRLRVSCRSAWDRVRKQAKLGTDVNFHTLRHTFASHAMMMGMPLTVLQSILGHQSLAMTMRYSHLSAGHERRKLEDIGNWFATEMEPGARICQSQNISAQENKT